MKSKHLLLTLLMALLVPWAAFGQETLTVHDGTATNSNVPVHGLWADAYLKCEMVYPASELSDMGCGTINKMMYYATSPASEAWTGTFQVFMKEVTDASISSFYGTDGATIVYEGTLNGTQSTMEITFSTPYDYNGGNLLVGVYQTAKGNYKGITWAGEAVDGASVQGYNSSSLSSVSPSQKNFLPKTTFTYTPSPYAPPATIAYTNNEPGNTTVSWTAPNTTETVTGYKYRYKKTAVTDWDGWYTLGASTTSGTLAGLDYSTEYEFEVKAVYGENESCSAKKVTFTTLSNCMTPENLTITDVTDNSATFNWTEGFGDGQWMFGYKKTTEDTYTTMAVAAADLPLTLEVFEEQTTYNVKVYPVCDETKVITDQFTTKCTVIDITTLPNNTWSEDFADYSAGNFSDPCWENKHIEGTGTGVFTVNTSTIGGNATPKMQLPDMSVGTLTKLRLPGMLLPNSNFQFVIDMYRSSSTYNASLIPFEGIRVYASADGEIEGATEMAFIPRQYNVSNDAIPAEAAVGWYTYELPIPMSGTCYIILRGESQYSTASYFDNLMIEPASACGRPGTPVASNVTNHSATLTWTAPEGQTAWQIAYKAGEDFDPTDAEALATATVMDVEDNPYTFVKTLDAATTYYMYVRGNCGTDGYSKWCKTACSFTTLAAAPAPTNLTVTNVSAFTADVYWNAGGGDNETSWEIFYTDDATFDMANYTGGAIDVTTLPTAENPYPLEGLTEETPYRLWVRGNNGTDGNSAWVGPKSFTTDEACPMPTLNAATNITQTGANISWNASPDVESYTLQYREAAYVEGLGEEFDATSIPSGWAGYTGLLAVEGNTGTATLITPSYGTAWSFGANHNVLTGIHAYVNIFSNNQRWLVTPKFEVSVDNLEFDMALTAYSASTMAPQTTGTDDKFMVLVSTDDMATWTILRQWTNEESAEYVYNNISATEAGEHVTLDMSAYNGQEVYVAFYGESTTSNADNNLHIDNVMCGTFIEAGEWETASEEAETPYTLVPENVQPNKKYDVQVKANCGEEYSASISFTTLKDNVYVFLGTEDDDWSNGNNWSPVVDFDSYDPDDRITINDDVIIRADVTIPALEDWDWAYEANKVTFEGGATLTIADGGRLASNNSVNGTIQKHINHYEDYYGRDNYYLLSLPVSTGYYGYNPSNAGMITDSEFDLYYFDEAQTGMEWRSYNPGDNGGAPFSLEQRKGYLYANSADVDLSFNGTFMRSDLPVIYNLSNEGTGEFAGLNLVGNPFICQAYLAYLDGEDFLEVDYYVLDGDAIDVVPTADYINPCSGAFVVADEDMYDPEEEEYSVYFISEINSGVGKKKAAALNITLDNNNRSGKHLDVARLRLGQGIGLKKFMLNPNGSKIYFPQANADYSVVYTENAGEMPLNFKAESNGTYRLSFSNENVEFNYLHLIDNMTGADVDLLATPSYSFEANSTDYASRFTIVFATGKTDDSFAYFSNGSFVISNEGNATLQVVDVMGRIISSETINGSANVSVNAAPGVYMLRLVNGDNVKVQKVVVK